jgi:DNA modification methylase
MSWLNKTHVGDCRELLARMAGDGVRANMCVTSPPYWGLRDYGVAGAIGLEPTLAEWVTLMVDVCRGIRSVLADDGTLWLNLGDAYANDGKWGGETGGKQSYLDDSNRQRCGREKRFTGLKPKNLMGQPWRVAFALQDDGWYLRSDIIWHKPNQMPENVSDRPTKAHEYIFLLSKSEQYYYDAAAIKEKASPNTHARMAAGYKHAYKTQWAGSPDDKRHPGGRAIPGVNPKAAEHGSGIKQNESFSAAVAGHVDYRNKRTVWSVPTEGFPGAHFATFPRDLISPCVLAGSAAGGIVLDPFMGSGTTAQVATDLGRQFIGCELNHDYVAQHELRRTTTGMSF